MSRKHKLLTNSDGVIGTEKMFFLVVGVVVVGIFGQMTFLGPIEETQTNMASPISDIQDERALSENLAVEVEEESDNKSKSIKTVQSPEPLADNPESAQKPVAYQPPLQSSSPSLQNFEAKPNPGAPNQKSSNDLIKPIGEDCLVKRINC